MLGYTDPDTAIAPGTYVLRQDEWCPGTQPGPHVIPLSDVRISIAISHETGRMKAFVAERPLDDPDPVTVPVLCIGIPIHNWPHRYPELYDLLAELMRRRRRTAEEPSAVDTVRALLEQLGFTDATPATPTPETPPA